jgi:anti-anti-sigma factor
VTFDQGQPFDIRQEHTSEGVLTMRLSGEFDLSGCEAFEAALERFDSRFAEIVIDLRELSFIDSSALRSLLCAKTNADEKGLRLSVALPADGHVRRVFELTGTDRVLGPD